MKNKTCFFVTDLHGHLDRYEKLFKKIEAEMPAIVFLGGDLLPSAMLNFTSSNMVHQDFVSQVLGNGFRKLKQTLGENYPQVYLILGNDDGKLEEPIFLDLAAENLWKYAHNRSFELDGYTIFGYSYVPPTPFALKDWERYDVSRYVDPGCSSPEVGYYSVKVTADEKKWSTIKDDLKNLTKAKELEKAIFLFHAPPYETNLDRADLDGKMVDHAPLDVHVGSIAIKRFIKARQPYITLHGHVHETARITGSWQDRIGKTYCFSAAHDGKELALVKFDIQSPEEAVRELL
jgi:Icc-related predicted phosphoesterase